MDEILDSFKFVSFQDPAQQQPNHLEPASCGQPPSCTEPQVSLLQNKPTSERQSTSVCRLLLAFYSFMPKNNTSLSQH